MVVGDFRLAVYVVVSSVVAYCLNKVKRCLKVQLKYLCIEMAYSTRRSGNFGKLICFYLDHYTNDMKKVFYKWSFLITASGTQNPTPAPVQSVAAIGQRRPASNKPVTNNFVSGGQVNINFSCIY